MPKRRRALTSTKDKLTIFAARTALTNFVRVPPPSSIRRKSPCLRSLSEFVVNRQPMEPRVATGEEENAELIDMKRRFWVSTILTVPLLILAMSEFLSGDPVRNFVGMRNIVWLSFAVASPVVLWGGWPFFVRFWQSIVN